MTVTEPAETDFDPDELRDKYRAERDKRIREDGNEQYVEVSGEFAHFVNDPYLETEIEREPKTDEVDIVVIGGGFGGLQMGARLREAGVEGIRVIEKGGDFGGTWYWNRYPGAMCDVESYVYLPLLEELDYVPTEKYVKAREILAHSRAIGRHYDLYDNALFQTEVTGMTWEDASERWIVETNRGDAIRARFVAMANGPLHRPKLPGIDGIESFEGHTFHTSRWDYDYTGGGPDGGLDKLADKRVGIIGTGATAVQAVPHLGEGAQQLFVFQRTPSSVDVRANRSTDPEWAAALEPGWHRRRMENFNSLVSGVPQTEDLVQDGWTDIIGKTLALLRKGAGEDGLSLGETLELADFQKMNEVRARVDELIDDPNTADSLKAYYRQFCKRPCFHDEYLQTFNRANVNLVDTDGQGIDRITEHGIVANGQEYELDCIVFATGFEVGTGYSRRAGYETVGRGGLSLSDHWADGARTVHGIHSHGFPNCFIMSQTQGGFTVNYPHMLDELSIHIAAIVSRALDGDHTVVEATADAEEAWVQEILRHAGARGDFFEQCTPGYYNNEGKPSERSMQDAPYGRGSIAFFDLLKQWRESGEYEGVEFS